VPNQARYYSMFSHDCWIPWSLSSNLEILFWKQFSLETEISKSAITRSLTTVGALFSNCLVSHQTQVSPKLGLYLAFFKLPDISPEKEKKSRYWKLKWFWRFSTARSEGKIEQKSSNFYIWFSMSAKIIEGQLKFCTSCMVYSHIWLNTPRDESHFFYIFIWMLVTLAKNKNS
jgi:hypothetical protein